jgi:hypothetical protein
LRARRSGSTIAQPSRTAYAARRADERIRFLFATLDIETAARETLLKSGKAAVQAKVCGKLGF